jgi:hypothetical protein
VFQRVTTAFNWLSESSLKSTWRISQRSCSCEFVLCLCVKCTGSVYRVVRKYCHV